MALASLDDVNAHLPYDKLAVLPGNQEFARAQIDTDRVIKGELSTQYLPATLATWADPNSTPTYIRAIAGRLTAAFYYRLRYAEDSRTTPEYAQFKYDEAMMMLRKVIEGVVLLSEVIEIEPFVSDLRFYPDESAIGPFFTMEREFI